MPKAIFYLLKGDYNQKLLRTTTLNQQTVNSLTHEPANAAAKNSDPRVGRLDSTYWWLVRGKGI